MPEGDAGSKVRQMSFAGAITRLQEMVKAHGGQAMIAVDGYSAAGKSTLADALADATGAVVVRGDDFYRVMDDAVRARLSPREGITHYYDWQRLRDEVLEPLSRRQAATYHPYDWESGQLARRPVTIPAASVFFLEGLFVSRPELKPYFDFSVLVDTPAATRRRRQLGRADASSEWLRRWDAAERLFFEHVRPRETFDVIVV